ncbi:hypothetical protein [Actinacidiphila acididurans]|uniref:Bulb-type lectin domain-containing protein n=1 Tax=Actinacidiphila acididurans TaxID=2784346 RepID=A0ABS2TS15_9ACTN|nr:hypothetical protein [Actinacidiphila acididurans]MBM9506130.1 hypothetical protein [Actinacidiphila acididurans]
MPMRLRSALAATRLAATMTAAAAAAVLVPSAATAAPASANDAWIPCPVGLTSNKVWAPGSNIGSGERWCVGQYQLTMQHDGNLVIYDVAGHPLWNSQTEGHSGAYATMQNDGNFVVYQGSQWLWNSQTGGNTGAYYYLCFQTDGNLVVYAPVPNTTPCHGAPRWWSGT